MLQSIVLILILFIIYIIWSEVKQHGSSPGKEQGEVIDISEAWIDSRNLPYQLKGHLVSGAELSLYNLLFQVLQGSAYRVCPQVRLADIVDLSARAENRQEYLNRIRIRTVDLLICEQPGLVPRAAITLEDKSTVKREKVADRFTANVIKASGLSHIIYDLSNLPDEGRLLSDLSNAGLTVTGFQRLP
ncbi:MAG TPA: DUF2726 domain-containing protein [Syntrophomonadaceae bacterium]|nr:DUF2726 domain-containing protein [Syntrophomonadaceae bacterium]